MSISIWNVNSSIPTWSRLNLNWTWISCLQLDLGSDWVGQVELGMQSVFYFCGWAGVALKPTKSTQTLTSKQWAFDKQVNLSLKQQKFKVLLHSISRMQDKFYSICICRLSTHLFFWYLPKTNQVQLLVINSFRLIYVLNHNIIGFQDDSSTTRLTFMQMAFETKVVGIVTVKMPLTVDGWGSKSLICYIILASSMVRA